MVQGFADPSFIVSGAISSSNIKAIFVFNPVDKQYYRIYPNPDRKNLDNLPPIILQLPFWVYSDSNTIIKAGDPNSNGRIKYKTEKLEYNFKIEWPAGWNFISVSEEMIGKKLEDIKGTCNIEKAYIWNSESSSQKWQPWTDSIFAHSELIGYGFLVKFTDKCTLGSPTSNVNPPSLPAEKSNNLGQQTISSVVGYKDSYSSKESIELTVEGRDSLGDLATSSDGWNMQYYTYSLDQSKNKIGDYLQEYLSSGNYNGNYDTSEGKWRVNYWAPSASGSYMTEITLYCGKTASSCWSKYGHDYEVKKMIYFVVN